MNAVAEAVNVAAAIQNDVDSILAEPIAAFTIDSDGKADWYLKQLACYDAEIALVEAQFEATLHRLQSDKEGLRYLYQGQLETYIGARIQEDKLGRKSVILQHGTCAWRNVPASVKVADPRAATLHAQATGLACVQTVEQLDIKAYREFAQKRLETDAEILPGIEVTPARESFSIKFGK